MFYLIRSNCYDFSSKENSKQKKKLIEQDELIRYFERTKINNEAHHAILEDLILKLEIENEKM